MSLITHGLACIPVKSRAHRSAASGRLEAVHELLNAGANADAANEKGQTPL